MTQPNLNPDFGIPSYHESPFYQPKPPFSLSKGDTAFAVAAVAVCLLWSALGLFGGMALGYLLAVVALMALMGVYLGKGQRVSAFAAVSGGLALGLGAVFLCTTNETVRFFATAVSLLLALCCFHSLAVGPAVGNRETAGIFYTAAATVGNIGVAVKSLFSNENGERKAIGKALVGLACSLPVLIVLMPLLLSSDFAFQGMMDTLFRDGSGTLLKCAFGLALAFPVVAYGLSLKHRRTAALPENTFPGIDGVYLLSFLSVISVIYLMYLFSQLAYFFSAFRGFLPEGDVTVAEYARKGFFEMSAIAAINLALVIGTMVLAKKQDGRVSLPVKAVCTFIAVFTLIIIATALSKMALYIRSFGMTELRLTTSTFMVFLAVVFTATLLRLYLRRINVAQTALVTAGLLVLILGVGNVDHVCARYNYEAWESGTLENVDVDAIYRLGHEGIPYLVKLADSAEPAVAEEAREWLMEAYRYDYFALESIQKSYTLEQLKTREPDTGFSHYSLPRAKAYDCLYAYYATHPEFAEQCWWPYQDAGTDENGYADNYDSGYAQESDGWNDGMDPIE